MAITTRSRFDDRVIADLEAVVVDEVGVSGQAMRPPESPRPPRARSRRSSRADRAPAAITSRPSIRAAPAWTPNTGASRTACAASAAAISSLLGMQPTRAQVVPCGPPSIRTSRSVCSRTRRYAASPAVPAPMIATSTLRSAMTALPTDGFARLPRRNIAPSHTPANVTHPAIADVAAACRRRLK